MLKPVASGSSQATTAPSSPQSADKAREAIAKLAFGTGRMVSMTLIQRYLDAQTDDRAAWTFLRQLFPVMYRLQPDAQRLLSRTMINRGWA